MNLLESWDASFTVDDGIDDEYDEEDHDAEAE